MLKLANFMTLANNFNSFFFYFIFLVLRFSMWDTDTVSVELQDLGLGNVSNEKSDGTPVVLRYRGKVKSL